MVKSKLQIRKQGFKTKKSATDDLYKIILVSKSKTTFGIKHQKKTKPNKTNHKPWFNFECPRARNEFHKTRKQYNKYKTNYYKNALKQVSKEYKNKMASNLRRYKNTRIQKLRNLKHPRPKDFWKIISVGKTEKQSAPLEDL